jgi:cell division septation protein DedD
MSYREKAPGTWWDWTYKDALPTGSNIPNFEVQGRKSLLSVFFSRKTLTSSQLANSKVSVLCFIPKPDHSTEQFASSLINSIKTSVIISRYISNIHLFITCASLEEFDTKVASRIPSGVNIWADINGEIAEKFGVKPLIAEVNVADILSSKQSTKAKYTRQTLPCIFFCIGNIIVKSPAMQPKLQVVSIDILKSVLEALESVQFSVKAAQDPKHFASSLTEAEIKSRYSKDWNTYLLEYQQMQQDLGLKAPEDKSATKIVSNDKTITTIKKTSKKPSSSSTAKKTDTSRAVKKATKPSTTKKSKKKPTTSANTNKKDAEKNLLSDGSIRSRL